MTPSPIFPQFFIAVMHLQWESPNTAVTIVEARGPIMAVKSSNDVPWERLQEKSGKML